MNPRRTLASHAGTRSGITRKGGSALLFATIAAISLLACAIAQGAPQSKDAQAPEPPKETAQPGVSGARVFREDWDLAMRQLRTGLAERSAQSMPPPREPLQDAMDKADALIRKGDIPSARMWLASAYSKGDPKAAFRLAESYDPGMVGPFPRPTDAVRARDFYEKALEGGIAEARERIERLDADAAAPAP